MNTYTTVPFRVPALVTAFLVSCSCCHPFDFDRGPVFSIQEENDLVVSTDRHYTQGIRLSYLERDNHLPGWLNDFGNWLPKIGFSNAVNRIGFEIGQSIYTPGDLSATQLLPDDRPYAGWLYTGLTLQRRGVMSDKWLTLENIRVNLGVIGPESLAEEAQTWIHEVRGFELPRGWDNQLNFEPGIAVRYQRAARFSFEGPEPRYFDAIPHAGFSLGNVETSLRAGGILRAGINLPEDFGIPTISSLAAADGGWSREREHSRWGFYVFGGIEGWIVGYTTLLDGNLWQSSHSVEKEPFVAESKAGFAFVVSRLELGFTYVYRTREFTGQERDNGYGSVFGKLKF